MLATFASVSKSANLRSAGVDSRGTPSSKSCDPDAPSRRPLSPDANTAASSSFHADLNCSTERVCSNPYRREYLSSTLRLRTNVRAPGRVESGTVNSRDSGAICLVSRRSVLERTIWEMVQTYQGFRLETCPWDSPSTGFRRQAGRRTSTSRPSSTGRTRRITSLAQSFSLSKTREPSSKLQTAQRKYFAKVL